MQPEKGQFSCFKLKNSISILLTLSVTGVSIEGAEEPEQGRGQDWEHWISGGMGDSSSNIFLPPGRQVPYCKKVGLYFLISVPVPTCPALPWRGRTAGASPFSVAPAGSRVGEEQVSRQRALHGSYSSRARAQHWQAQKQCWCSTAQAPFELEVP